MTDFLLCIDGAWTPGSDGATLPLRNPATEEVIGSVAVATDADIDRAARAAADGFRRWRAVPAVQRGAILRRAAGLLRERIDTIAPQITREQGKTLPEARFEVLVAIDVLEWFAEEGRRAYGRIVPDRVPGVEQTVYRDPIGPVAGFVPWNFGLGQAARKVGAALAAGCSLVLKAPEEAPASCAVLVAALHDASLPAGVLNLLTGVPAQISAALIPHPVIRKISFTGSSPVGKQLAALAGAHMKPVTMELGGHSPVIVTADVDVDALAPALAAAKYRNAGQACISPTRFLIEAPAYDRFVDAFVTAAAAIRVGDGMVEGVQMGPLSNPRRLVAMQALVADAIAAGARLCQGGSRIGNTGWFFAPTVLADVPLSARAMTEEPFGPVALMRPFTTLDEAIAEANRLDYALSAFAFTRSDQVARRVSREIEAGMLSLNTLERAYPELPYGGFKDSGQGSEGGPEALNAYLITRYVARGG